MNQFRRIEEEDELEKKKVIEQVGTDQMNKPSTAGINNVMIPENCSNDIGSKVTGLK